jgi:hypothetical protein
LSTRIGLTLENKLFHGNGISRSNGRINTNVINNNDLRNGLREVGTGNSNNGNQVLTHLDTSIQRRPNEGTPFSSNEDDGVLTSDVHNINNSWFRPDNDEDYDSSKWNEPILSLEVMTSVQKVEELVKRIQGKRIDKLYDNDDMFFLFMHLCVQNVIFKRKWMTKCMTVKYIDFVTISDEALAFLVLENNAQRYFDMVDDEVEKKDYAKPIYTDVVKKGCNMQRGWTQEGKKRFMTLYKQIYAYRNERNNKKRIEDLGKMLMEREKIVHKRNKCTKSGKDMENEEMVPEITRKIDTDWENFMKNTSKKTNCPLRMDERSNLQVRNMVQRNDRSSSEVITFKRRKRDNPPQFNMPVRVQNQRQVVSHNLMKKTYDYNTPEKEGEDKSSEGDDSDCEINSNEEDNEEENSLNDGSLGHSSISNDVTGTSVRSKESSHDTGRTKSIVSKNISTKKPTRKDSGSRPRRGQNNKIGGQTGTRISMRTRRN